MQTLTTGCNKLSPPKNGTPDRSCTHLAVSFRLYVHIYVAAVTLKSSTWKLLRAGFCAHALSLSLSLSLVHFVYGPYVYVLRPPYVYVLLCALRIRTYVDVLRFPLSRSPYVYVLTYTLLFSLRIRSYVYVLTSTYLRRGSLGEKIFAKFFPKRSTRSFGNFFGKFSCPLLRRIYYVEYITYNNTYIYTYIYTYIFYLFSTK